MKKYWLRVEEDVGLGVHFQGVQIVESLLSTCIWACHLLGFFLLGNGSIE